MNTLKLTNNQTQILYFWANDEYFEHTDKRVLKELEKIFSKDPYKDKKHAPTLILDYVGDILKSECESFIDYAKEWDDYADLAKGYKLILKKIEQSNYTPIKSNIETRFKILASLCIAHGILENKMQELADKIDENHEQCEDALDYYEGKVLEALEELAAAH